MQGFRLSPQQRRTWRLQEAAPLSELRAEASFEVRGELPALRQALRDLVARNEILRTRFPRVAGMSLPLQVIDAEGELPLEERDLRELEPDAQRAELAAIERSLRERGFDPETGPLWHAVLASLSVDRHVLVLHVSALCGDAAALRNMVREIGEPCEEPLQYADLAEWQSGLLESEDADVGRRYWQNVPEIAAPRLGSFAPRVREIRLERDIEASVAAALWLLLLHRRLDKRELVLGVRFDGRDYEELEGALGPFARTLPFSSSLDGELPLEELARRFEAWSKEAYGWQAFFTWEDGPEGVLYCPLAFESDEVPAGRSCLEPFQLKLACLRTPEGLRLQLHYDASSVSEPEALRLVQQMETLLARGEVDLLSAGERHRLLFEVNDTAWAAEPDVCVHRLFERWAEATPDAPAVRFEDRCLTYRELNERANRVARSLRRLGVVPEERVGLRLERSEELIVALLGVLKAGGAYVPLDPGQPEERLAYILEAAGASVVVTAARLAELLAGESGENLPDGAGPENLAYVIFTSGSTGQPKGVGIEHRHLASYVQAAAERLAFEPGMTYATVTTPAADLGNTMIFPALASGGCLDVVAADRAADPARLAERFRAHRPDCLKIVPSHLAALLDGADPEAVLPRRRLVFGGEALSWGLVARVPEACRVFNHYGPSETTVGVIAQPVGEAVDSATVPLGRPLAGATVYLLDRHGNPVPAGLPGEVFLGGSSVGRGYLGRPDLTAERFVPDPWGGSGRRLYRTGDLARRLPDDVIEFLGRVDFQIKIRGFRVEPEEIGLALERHPSVRQAVVVAREESLVAYVVPGAGDPSVRELRAFLQGSLPEYMIPSAFVRLDRLPLTANGKIDRAALPAPEAERTGPAFVAPRTGVEELVAGIWSQVLGREPVGAHDSFFELGGHSLLATQVVSRVRQVFGLEVPLARIFDAPTVAGFAAVVSALLEQRTGPPEPPLVPVPREAGMPLSFAQERLWFLDQLQPGSAVYNLPAAVRLNGRLDSMKLESALGELVRRHEALRTTFGPGPVQLVAEPDSWTLPRIDLRGLPDPRREALRLAAENAAEPFDLQRGPLLRTRLLVLGPEEHVLLFNVHHIVSDGWSMGVIVREVAALYGGSPLPALPIQYADFAAWQRQWLSGEVLDGQLRYWREQLAGAPPLLELPTDRPRPAVRSGRGAYYDLVLPAELAASLRDLGRREGATLFMTLLAGFAALLGRHTRQDDVPVGSPIANRNRAEVEPLVGFFVNTLVLRVGLEGDPGFAGLLSRVRQTALGAYAHQDLPFEKVVEHLAPQRSLGHTPLFQVLTVLQNAPAGILELPGLSFEPVEMELGTAKFDLGLSWSDGPCGLLGRLEHSLDLFDAPTVRRLLGQLRFFLEAAAADPAKPLSELPLLARSEQHQLLAEWNDTASPYPRESSIPELFERQVERTPDAIALTAADRQLTYRELDREANRLARTLAELGVEPDAPVGVFLERSPELIVALLAILKAGGAYLVLDPDLPAERLEFLAQDAGLRLVVAERELPFDVTRAPVHGTGSGEPLASRSGPSHLAYVSYTSGSTGRPKGVCVEHRAVVRLVRNSDYLRLGPGDAFLQHSPVSFDASTLEIWGPLLNGGRLVVCPPGRLSTDELGRIVRDFGVTSLWLTAGLFHAMVEHGTGALGGLRHLLAGGDVLSPEHVRAARAALPATRIVNGYGPTENTTFTCCHVVGPDPDASRSVPIGRPIANTRAYVLDADLRPVPPGVPGELCAGGDGLARGYLGRPDLTAERFVPDPSGFGERLYRTGDLARRLADGTVEFLGRIDRQVKIRGFRIEPGEIEAALVRHPEVGEAVVVVREAAPGDRRLAAYAMSATATGPELRSHLAEVLPEPMVPAWVLVLDRLPLTPNGKVDRAALPEPVASERRHISPRTPAEELMAAIWSEVLGVDELGAEDGFFELGGHSLLATQVISRVRRTFGVEVPLAKLFEESTLAGFAAAADQARRRQTGLAEPPLVAARRQEGIPLSFAQQRLWFLDQLLPGNPLYNIPGAARLTGPLEPWKLHRVFGEIARRHEVLRTTFQAVDGQPVQVVAPALPLPLPVIDLAGLPQERREEETARRIAEEARLPFDLARGPLVRTTLLRLGREEHVALVTFHHIVADGWSTGILFREIAALFQGEALPELPLQYADFALWQRDWLQGEELDRQLSYWRSQLAGAPAVLELPADRPRPSAPTHRGAATPVALPSDAVQRLCRREGATPFMVLLAAWATLLGRHANRQDVLVGTPVAGRNRREIEGLIGFFVNTLVMRTDLSGEPDFSTVLQRVRQTALDGFAHQDLPFERLVEELVTERDLAHSPLFQAMLVLQNAPEGDLSLPGLGLRPLAADGGMAKFDLSLAFQERRQGTLQYSTDLFDASTAARLAARFTALLEAVAADPSIPLSRIPLLDPSERRELVAEWPEEEPSSLHGRFEAQARRAPGAVAVTCGGAELTYGELNRAANRLARHLRGLGVRPEDRVGLSLERSLELPVALLGILKAGAAYVPLDPTYPRERLDYMVEDAGIRVVVDAELLGEVPAVLSGGDLATDGAGLAYVIYTSGSTGRPKGALVSHGNVTRLFDATRDWFGFGESDVWTLFHSYAFDFSVWELWGALLYGGRLVVVPYEVSRSPESFLDLLVRERVTVLNQTPSAFAQLARVDEERGGVATDLRLVVFGGEALDLAGLAPWFERHGDETPRLVNMYGITETTVHVTYRPLSAEDTRRRGVIGGPIPDLSLHALDPWLQPVPAGVPGELAVGGAGLARGYLGRPELTAERFVPDPFSGRPGERLYRSGDLGRFLPDGDVEYLGRIDHQVKIRGFRIEPGEIEAVLSSHPAVRECAVLAREGSLVAYAVPAVPADLRGFLAARLPEYMVPAVLVPLESLPLTANGKVDRKSLPAPERREVGKAPLTPTGELMAAIWGEVLGVDGIGPEEDFFALGGHSLLATQVISRVRRTFGVEVPLAKLFEQSTLAGFAAAADRALRERTGLSEPPLVAGRQEAGLPLSFAQQRLWFLDQLLPGSPLYNIPGAARLTGPLEPWKLRRVFGEIVRRHEVLRTTFQAVDGQPVQVIAPALPLPLPVIDLGGLPQDRREEETARRIAEEAALPFDLGRGPLMRTTLLRLGSEEHVALVTFHHIVSDGWSTGILFREIAALFQDGTLPELPLQYADFALWQRSWLQGEELDRQLSYWRRQLGGAPTVLELPIDRPRPSLPSYRGASTPVVLPPALSTAVQRLCRREGVTPFMLLLAAWSAVLGRHAGQQDVLVGTPVAGRNRQEIEGLIGFFVNTLVMRTGLTDAPAFSTLLRRARQTALDGFAHQDVPFERLVEELATERDLTHSPLFQAMLVLQNAPGGSLSLPGLTLSPLAADAGMAKFDLSLAFQEREDRTFEGALQYSTDLFDAGTAARLGARFVSFLEAAVADPELPVSELPLLLPEERQALCEWNDTARPYPTGVCLHELIARQAERAPDAVAVSFEGRELTCRELERRANRLAHRLIALGVEPDGRVGVLLERSLEMIVALLGVLKAGAAYVPLDPTYPAERLAVQVETSGARVVLAQGRLAPLLPGERTVLLDEGWQGTGEPDTAPDVRVGEENLAYVLFTSGSTGTPKGVMIPHRGIVNRLLWMQEAYGLTPRDRVLQKTPFSFDVSLWEFFWPLLTGARLVFARPEGHKDPAYLADLIARERITTVHFVPSMLQAFLEAPGVPGLSSLRRVVASGEALPPELVRRFFARLPGAELHNLYGPTEASVDVSFWACEPEPVRVPIGRPIANLCLHVVDREQHLQPLGVAGELLLGGVGLARGYLGRPDLTAAAFVPDPFSGEPGARLYRTGDLARVLEDGNVEYLGRIDHQVKIRGFRIELGEIEAVLASHPSVRECVVVAREDVPGVRLLAAYVVPAADGIDEAALRALLASRLPEYMVPAVFVPLAAMPLSSNGKVDRRSLPAPDRGKAGFTAPRTRAEAALAEIWQELLGLERVGAEDHFFELGGHSLLATRLLARVKQAFGVEISLREVFKAPTVAGLAGLIDDLAAVPADEDELAALMDELDLLSDEEARARLEDLDLAPRES